LAAIHAAKRSADNPSYATRHSVYGSGHVVSACAVLGVVALSSTIRLGEKVHFDEAEGTATKGGFCFRFSFRISSSTISFSQVAPRVTKSAVSPIGSLGEQVRRSRECAKSRSHVMA
jgi:hypothetical protein